MVRLIIFFSLILSQIACIEQSEPSPREGQNRRVQTLWVHSEQVDCMGEAPQKCLQVRKSPTEKWELFYDKIEGFEFKSGFLYQLQVIETDVKNPPADASNRHTKLLKVIDQAPDQALQNQ